MMTKQTGISQIVKERCEQKMKHARSVADDVNFNNMDQLRDGAIGLLSNTLDYRLKSRPVKWDPKRWRHMCGKSYKDRLVIAGALIAAEIDRIQNDPDNKIII